MAFIIISKKQDEVILTAVKMIVSKDCNYQKNKIK